MSAHGHHSTPTERRSRRRQTWRRPLRGGLLNVTAVVAVLALALTVVLGGIVLAPAAQADPLVPEVSLSAATDGTKGMLAGESEDLTLTIANGSGDPWYNLSVSVVVPVGIAFVESPVLGSPKIYGAGTALPDGTRVPADQNLWVWQDVSDLPVGAVRDFQITVKPAQPAQGTGETAVTTVFPVGSVFDVTANAYTSTNPRYVPIFPGSTGKGGQPAKDATRAGAASTTTTQVNALRVTKNEPSAESELVRGVHDHTTKYTITVKNTSEGPTTATVVTDFVPAGLEFLSCGAVDNTAAGREEYPGSGLLTGTPAVVPCVLADEVKTVEKTSANAADFPADLADGVYTKVTWGPFDLAPGETREIVYAAGIPQAMNTMTWDGVDVGSLGATGQAANLDNNNGATTRHSAGDPLATDGDVYRNLASATGTYGGVVRTATSRETSDSDDEVVHSMDLRVLKTVETQPVDDKPTAFAGGNAEEFFTGKVAKYTLNLKTSEYASSSSITLVDVIPNGLCPVLPDGVTVMSGQVSIPQLDGTSETFTGADAADFPVDCIPGVAVGGGDWAAPAVSGATVDWVAYDPILGRFVMSFSVDDMAATAEHNVVYPVLMRGNYTGKEGTTSSLDGFTNTVTMTATTTGLFGAERDVVATVADDSSATIVAGPSSISKKVLPRAEGIAVGCPAVPTLYVEGNDPATSGDLNFVLGDRVCYELTVTFAKDAETRNPVITDMMPEGITYAGAEATLLDSAGIKIASVTWNDTDADSVLTWKPATHTAGNGDRLVPRGSQMVAYVWGTVSSVSESAAALDKPQNLMKYQQENVQGEIFFARDQADIQVEAGLQLLKGVRDVNGVQRTAETQNSADGTTVDSNRDGVEVVEGEKVTYRIDLSGAAQNIESLVVEDKLPDGITAADVSIPSGADGGAVEVRADGVYIVWPSLTVTKNATKTLTYTVTIPRGTEVATTLENTASIKEYKFLANTGVLGETVTPGAPGVPDTGTIDSSSVFLPDVEAAKRVVGTDVRGVNNNDVGTPAAPATTPLPQAVHGEYITYEYSVTVPANTTVKNAVLKDSGTLALGAAHGAYTVDPARTAMFLPADVLPSDFTLDAATGTLTFPTTYDNTTAAEQTFTVQISAYTAGATAPAKDVWGQGDILTNTATFQSDSGTKSPTATVEYVVPEPTITKTVDDGDQPVMADQTLTYTLTATNASGRPTSFDTVVTDCVPAALINVTPGVPAQGVVSPLGTCSGGTQIVWTVGAVAGGETKTLTYTATVSPQAAGGASYTNTANLKGYALDALPSTNPRQLELTSEAEATVTVEDATIVKTVDAPSGAIGDLRSFTVTVTLPKHVNFYTPTLTDIVPAGLRVNPASIAITAPDVGVLFACSPTAGTGTDGGDVSCTASGDITSALVDRTITLTYSATIVQNAARTTPTKGNALTNTASFAWTSTSGGTGTTTVSDDATVTVTEPNLTIKKYVEGKDAQDAATAVTAAPSSTLHYSITVTNSAVGNSATAHDAVITDVLPVGLVNAALATPMPPGISGSITGRTIVWRISSIAPGATVTLDFTADLAASAALTAATLTNTASITEYWSTTAPAGGVADETHRRYTGGSDPAVVVPEFPFVTVAKATADGASAKVGTPFPWTLTITNDGNGHANTVTATDTLPTGWEAPVVTGVTRNGAAMAPGDWSFDAVATRWTFTDVAADDIITVNYTTVPTAAAYAAPGAGVGTGAPDSPHTNSVSLTATDSTDQAANATGGYTGPDASANAYLRATDVTVVKERVGADRLWTGDAVTFTLTATNNGPQSADAVTIEDTLPAGLTFAGVTTPVTFSTAVWDCSVTGESVRCAAKAPLAVAATASVTVTAKATAPAGAVISADVTNIATVSTSTPETDTTNNTDPATITVWAKPSIAIDKKADVAKATVVAGDDDTQYVLDGQDPARIAHFSITVTNTGPIELRNVEVNDALAAQCDNLEIPDLAPDGAAGSSYTFTCDGPAPGSLGYTNSATVTGTTSNGDDVTATDTSRVELSSISIAKTGTIAQVAPVAGDLVTFAFVVTNTGSSTLTDVDIDDVLPGMSDITFGDWPGAAGTLAPGEAVEAAATYPLTLADVDAETVTNTATTTGTDPAGQSPTDEDTVTVIPGNAPSISLVKTGALATAPDGEAGDTVTYTFTVTNTGNVTLRDVGISDPMPGLGTLTYDWSAASDVGTLEPNEVVTATAEYSLTQSDVDAGVVDNTASVEGTAPDGTTIVSDTDSWQIPITPQPLIDVVKEGVLADDATGRVGDLVEYTFTVTNPGSVTLTGVSISDALPGLSSISYTWSGATGVLAPGDIVTATASYPLTQADVDLGYVENVATVEGTPPTGDPVDSTDSTTVTVPALPGIALVKTGALAAGSQGLLGDTVEYTFTATNTGNVTLHDVDLEDVSLPGLSPLTLGAWPDAAGVLAPGETITATASYVLVQADIELGYVDNLATTEGTAPSGRVVDDEDDARVDTLQTPEIVLDKSAALAPGHEGRVGETVEYGFVVRNSGNVTLTQVEIVDLLEGLSEIVYTWPSAVGVLAPGEEVRAAATYVVTQEDVDAGVIHNAAEVTGTPPGDIPVTDPAEATVVLPQAPSIALIKAAQLADGATGIAGDTVDYTFTVTNTGDVTLHGVTIADPLDGLSDVAFGAWPGAEGELAPGASVNASATYVLTQADVDAGQVTNVATATGAPEVGDPVTDDASATVEATQRAAIILVKTGTITGSTAEFTFTVTNTGTVTLTGVSIADALPGLSEVRYGTWPATAGTLAPGQSVTASATLAVTAAHVGAGSILNTATVTGLPPTGDAVTATDTVTLVVPPSVGAGDLPSTDGVDVLPWTGAAVGGLSLLALGLVAGGILLLRRRPRRQH